jgi:hypothetical protein
MTPPLLIPFAPTPLPPPFAFTHLLMTPLFSFPEQHYAAIIDIGP